jgi:glycine cleavage system aminomethyltransferase T
MGEAAPTCHLTGGVRLGALARLAFTPLRRTPLVDEHVALGARLVPDGEWLDVADYGHPDAERRALVEGIGLRDTSRASLYDLQGLDAADLLQQLLPGLHLPRAGDVLVAPASGGSPVAVAGVGVEHWELRVEDDDARALEARLLTLLHIEHRQWEAYLTPIGESRASMALLGPRAVELAERVLGRPAVSSGVMSLDDANAANGQLWSFTWHGQAMLELRVPAGFAPAAWKALLSQGGELGIRPVGLLAVEELRDAATTGAESAAGPSTVHARTTNATSADA